MPRLRSSRKRHPRNGNSAVSFRDGGEWKSRNYPGKGGCWKLLIRNSFGREKSLSGGKRQYHSLGERGLGGDRDGICILHQQFMQRLRRTTTRVSSIQCVDECTRNTGRRSVDAAFQRSFIGRLHYPLGDLTNVGDYLLSGSHKRKAGAFAQTPTGLWSVDNT